MLVSVVSKALNVSSSSIKEVSLKRISVDARKKNDIHYIAQLQTIIEGNENSVVSKCKNAEITQPDEYKFSLKRKLLHSPVIVGSGPAGLFCALMLARSGNNPIIIERGKSVDKRTRDINLFWENGTLNTESNIQFGEGGAGTFSDGKLNTGINDIRARYVLNEFVTHGAPEEILIDAKPHIGTDLLKTTIKNIRMEIERLGGTFLFETKLCDFTTNDSGITGAVIMHDGIKEIIQTDNLILAIGHSARDTFTMLRDKGIELQQKAFSIGARIEHLQDDLDECQYGRAKHLLKAADYKLSTHLPDGRGVYTFCMCPGGYVVNASSEENMLCTNGMSYHARDNKNCNSALLVGITPADYNRGDVLDGMKLQKEIESNAYKAIGNFLAPVQRVGNFLGENSNFNQRISPTIKPGYEYYNISNIFPEFIADSMKAGIIQISERMPLFKDKSAIITAPETRSSSPIRIVRNDNFESVTFKGLYPCGEGAGYAGGIMSAAVDGIKCAEAILNK